MKPDYAKVTIAGEFPLHPKWNATIYRHSTVALHVHGYRARLRVAEEDFEIYPGDFTITPPNQESQYTLTAPGHHLCIHFRPAKGAAPAWNRSRCWRDLPECGLIRGTLELIIAIRRRFDLGAERSSQAQGLALAAVLSALELLDQGENQRSPRPRSNRAVTAAARKIVENLESPLDVPRLANSLALSQDYLSRRFKEEYRVTIPRFLLLRRMEFARRSLRETTLSIKEIGAQSGFPDPRHFNKVFRRFNGVSPTTFRQLAE